MRSLVAAVLLALLLLSVLVANATTWATRTVLDEAAFTSAVGRVLDTPALEEAIATRATDTAMRTLDAAPDRLMVVGRVVLGLPESPTRAEIEAALHTRILVSLDDPEVQAARDAAVTSVHGFMVDGATGRSDVVSVQGSQVVLDLGPLVERVAAAVDERLPQAGLADVAAADARLVLADAPALQIASRSLALMQALRVATLLAVVAILLLVVVVAHRRTRALGVAGLAIMLAGLAGLAISWVGGGLVGEAPEDPLVGAVARDVYAALVTPLVLQSVLIMAGGALLAVGSWLALQRRASTAPRSA